MISTTSDLLCWGGNTFSQVGDNSTATRGGARIISAYSDWVALSVGSYHSCALRLSGNLYCWGKGANHALGTGTTANAGVPTLVNGTWTSVSCGDMHTCATDASGLLSCWGVNTNGQLGNGNVTTMQRPTVVDNGVGPWASVAAGGSSTCGVPGTPPPLSLFNGTVNITICTGAVMTSADATGLTTGVIVIQPPGSGTQPSNYTLVLTPVGGGPNVTLVCSTPDTCTATGLQPGTTYTVDGTSNFPDGSTIPLNSLTLTTMDMPNCWGQNANGQFGNGLTSSAVAYPTNDTDVTWDALSLSGAMGCGISKLRLLCWGQELGAGNLGRNMTTAGNYPSPVEVAGGGDWDSVYACMYHACGIQSGGSLYCWGANAYGQLGINSTTSKSVPTAVASGETWAKLPAHGAEVDNLAATTCAITAAGQLFCWGHNAFGQIGDDSTTQRLLPTLVSNGSLWDSVATGYRHT